MDDRRVNRLPCNLLDAQGNTKKSTVAQIKFGDILILKSKDMIPADCVILSSADKNGQCYVQTDALDGERNLKCKTALIQINDMFDELFKTKSSSSLAAVV